MPHELLNLSQQINELAESVKSLRGEVQPLVAAAPKLAEIVEAYDSVIFGKKFLAGLAVVVGSIATIGGGVLWLLNWVRHGS